MSNLRPQVRAAVRNFLQSQEGHHINSDVLRIIKEEANLMKETQDIVDLLDIDPMEQLGEVRRQVDRLKNLFQVTSCSRVRTGFDYCAIDAVVTLEKCQNLQLTFKYERKPQKEASGCHIWYSIEASHNHGQRELLLVVQLWALAGVPSTEPAVSVQKNHLNNPEGEDGWEDIDEDVETGLNIIAQEGSPMIVSDDCPTETPKPNKKQRTSSTPVDDSKSMEGDAENEEGEATCDHYDAQLDPDLLHNLLESAGLLPMNEVTAFFLLMTFPFYEHEWDLIGYVLDEVFSSDSDDEESES